MTGTRYIKMLGLCAGIAIVNILAFSPAVVGLRLGASALAAAFGITLLLISALALAYGSYIWLFKRPIVVPVKSLMTHEDYVEGLSRYRHLQSLKEDIEFALEQLDRLQKKKGTLLSVLGDRFEATELSYLKFVSVIAEVEKLFYLNVKSVLGRLQVFDESEYRSIFGPKPSSLSRELLQKKTSMYNDYLTFVRDSLGTNEEILLKLDKLLLEISRLDSLDPAQIESMPCMQEIDTLIKQTKLYKQ